jgi:rRNA-processing protein FCF1
MEKVILDTSFIIACVREKIDFPVEFSDLELEMLIPDKVLNELKKIINSRQKLHHREAASTALKILDTAFYSGIEITGKNTDKAIISYSRENPDLIIATLDREIKQKTKNRKAIIRGKKKIEII